MCYWRVIKLLEQLLILICSIMPLRCHKFIIISCDDHSYYCLLAVSFRCSLTQTCYATNEFRRWKFLTSTLEEDADFNKSFCFWFINLLLLSLFKEDEDIDDGTMLFGFQSSLCACFGTLSLSKSKIHMVLIKMIAYILLLFWFWYYFRFLFLSHS